MGPQMRPHFMPGQQGFSQGGGPGGGPRDANFMNSNARFQSQYQRMANHAQQQAAAAAAMAGAAGGGGGQIPSPGALQRPPMMSNPMQNVSAMQNVSPQNKVSLWWKRKFNLFPVFLFHSRWGFMGARLALMPAHRRPPRS